MNTEAPTDLSKDRAAVMRHLCRNLFIAYIASIAPWFKLEAVHYEIAAKVTSDRLA